MSAQDNDLPAFPEAGLSNLPNGEFIHGRSGMGLRDYLAAKAMPAIFDAHQPNVHMTYGVAGALEIVAKTAYAMADAMLKARQS